MPLCLTRFLLWGVSTTCPWQPKCKGRYLIHQAGARQNLIWNGSFKLDFAGSIWNESFFPNIGLRF